MGRYSRSRSMSRSRSRSRNRESYDGYDEQIDGYRIHLADLGIDCTQNDIEKSFKKFGELKEVWLARNPPCFGFIVYKHRADGEDAIREMNGKIIAGNRIHVSWAKPRTRGRNKRFDPAMRCYQCGHRGHFSRDCDRRGDRYRDYSDDDDGYRGRRRSNRR